MAQPYYAEPGIELYCGDCIEVLAELSREAPSGEGLFMESADRVHVITDPPYEAEAHTQGRRCRSIGGGVRESPIAFAAITEAQRLAVGGVTGRFVTGWALIFCQVEAVQKWASACGDLEYIRTQIWRKPNGCPQFTGDRPGMGYEAICTLSAQGKKRWNGGGRHGVYVHNVEQSALHQTVKPLSLMAELVSLFTDPGELVIDPFAGSGTTLRACKDLGRRCIGIELNPEYCEIAKGRLAQEVLIS